jgi:hypothetical protein
MQVLQLGIVAAIGFAVSAVHTDGQKENAFVTVDVQLSKQELRPGESGELLVAFLPLEDIHVTAKPPVQFKIGATKAFELEGNPTWTVDTITGYLSTASPVHQAYRIPRTAHSGRHRITGTIVYFFCSDNEGWCRKSTYPLEMTFTVRHEPDQ